MTELEPSPQTIAMLQVRLVEQLRRAGGEMQRNNLRKAIRGNLLAGQFDRLVNPLIDRGELECKTVRLKCTCYDGRTFERDCTVYRLLTPSKKSKRS